MNFLRKFTSCCTGRVLSFLWLFFGLILTQIPLVLKQFMRLRLSGAEQNIQSPRHTHPHTHTFTHTLNMHSRSGHNPVKMCALNMWIRPWYGPHALDWLFRLWSVWLFGRLVWVQSVAWMPEWLLGWLEIGCFAGLHKCNFMFAQELINGDLLGPHLPQRMYAFHMR